MAVRDERLIPLAAPLPPPELPEPPEVPSPILPLDDPRTETAIRGWWWGVTVLLLDSPTYCCCESEDGDVGGGDDGDVGGGDSNGGDANGDVDGDRNVVRRWLCGEERSSYRFVSDDDDDDGVIGLVVEDEEDDDRYRLTSLCVSCRWRLVETW